MKTLLLVYLMFIGTAADIDVNTDRNGYEFIYHSNHSLLVTVHGQGCYYAYFDQQLHDSFIHEDLPQLERQIENIINYADDERKQATTIEEMKDKFHDLLADFTCLTKDIYSIQLDYVQCDFDHPPNTCGWKNNYQEALQWTRHHGGTMSLLTGPDGDHSSGYGFYIYLEANMGSTGDAAEIVSPAIALDAGAEMCLRFWYNMYGSQTGNLSLYATASNNPRHRQALWSRSGDQGQGWNVAEVNVPVKQESWTGQIKLHMRATKGSNIRGDIAVDDISSFPGSCISTQLSCSFETDFCMWSEVGALDQMNWLRNSGAAPSVGQGPSGAPTLPTLSSPPGGNKQYLYTDGATGQPGDRADLQSPLIRIRQPFCLRFLYYMSAYNAGELEVVLLIRNRIVEEKVLWHRSGQQLGDHWLPGFVTVTFSNPKVDVQVLFRAVRGSSVASDIAIDHIVSEPGTCEQPIG